MTCDAERLYSDWKEIGGCSCHTGGAPCSSCTHEGNPISLEENDDAWELNYTIEDVYNEWKRKQGVEGMSRTEIKDKGGSEGWVEVLPTDLNSLTVGQEVKINEVQTRITKLDMSSYNSKVIGFFTARDGTYDGKPNNFWGKHSNSDTKVWVKGIKSQPKKDFVVGKWYKCVDGSSNNILTVGRYYELLNTSSVSEGLRFKGECDGCYWSKSRFDINSESDYDPDTAHSKFVEDLKAAFPPFDKVVDTDVKESKLSDVVEVSITSNFYDSTGKYVVPEEFSGVNLSAYEVKDVYEGFVQDLKYAWDFTGETRVTEYLDKICKDFLNITKEESNMSNTQRKVVEVQLFDDAKGLPVQDSLVAKFDNVLTEDDNDTTIREVIMNNDIKKVLAAHNVKRSKVINQDILERTGNSVPLQPILLKDLRWKVVG